MCVCGECVRCGCRFGLVDLGCLVCILMLIGGSVVFCVVYCLFIIVLVEWLKCLMRWLMNVCIFVGRWCWFGQVMLILICGSWKFGSSCMSVLCVMLLLIRQFGRIVIFILSNVNWCSIVVLFVMIMLVGCMCILLFGFVNMCLLFQYLVGRFSVGCLVSCFGCVGMLCFFRQFGVVYMVMQLVVRCCVMMFVLCIWCVMMMLMLKFFLMRLICWLISVRFGIIFGKFFVYDCSMGVRLCRLNMIGVMMCSVLIGL